MEVTSAKVSIDWNTTVINATTITSNDNNFHSIYGFKLFKRTSYVFSAYNRDFNNNNNYNIINTSNTLLDPTNCLNDKNRSTDTDKESVLTKWIHESVPEEEPSHKISLGDDLRSIVKSNKIYMRQDSVKNSSSYIY